MSRLHFGAYRPLAILASVLLVPVLVVSGPARPAAANSAVGLANNAWLVTELGAQAMNAYQSPAAQAASAAEIAAATSATRATTTAPGISTKPGPSSKLGLVVNGIAVLGSMVAVWHGTGSEEHGTPPTVPMPSGTSALGTASYGYCEGGSSACTFNGTFGSGTGTQGRWRVTMPPSSVGSDGRYYIGYQQYSTQGAVPDPVYFSGSACCNPGEIYSHQVGTYYKRIYYPVNMAGNTIVGGAIATVYAANKGGPAPTVTDPTVVPRYIDTTITCKSAGGGSQVINSSVGPFTFDPATTADLPEVPFAQCPAGTWLDSGSREMRSDGTTTKVPLETYNAPSWVETQAVRFPECLPVGTTACQLHVKLIGLGGSEKECSNYVPGPENPCYKWLRASDRAERFKCYFGGYAIGLRSCRPLAEAYSVSPTLGVSTPVDPSNPNPDDPEVVDPDAPVSDPTPETTPGLNVDGCIPTGWEILNPFSVFKAFGCALKWAFVPNLDKWKAQLQVVRTAWANTLPGQWVAAIGGFTVPAFTESGCAGPSVDVPLGNGIRFQAEPLNACSGAAADLAALSKLILTVSVAFFGGLACVRAVGSGFNWNPGGAR